MSSRRRVPLVAVLAVALGLTGVASTLNHESNPSTIANGLGVTGGAESTALYCTGLGSLHSGLAGRVSFLNTTDRTRTLSVTIVSDTGARATTTVRLSAHSSANLEPNSLVAGNSFAVATQIDGGGVVADEVTRAATAQAPCTTSGVTQWNGAGFDTLVGSKAMLSIYNPTATAAVFNVSAYTSNGFVAPAPYQGFALGAHAQVELNLGSQIVNATDVGVRVNVLRGLLSVLGVQTSGKMVSLNPGTTSLVTRAWFARVTTANGALAQLRFANPNGLPANVSVSVKLGSFDIAPQSVTIGPYDSGALVVTPNPAIPAAGYASLVVSSSEPVSVALATGTGSGIALSSPPARARDYLVSDFAGVGFDAAAVTNTSSRTLKVTFTLMATNTQPAATSSTELAGHATQEILGVFNAVSTLSGTTLVIKADRADLVVTTTLPSTPIGVEVVSALDGG